ncbi:MAG TPA: GGDEF domain-containing protein [Thermoleophilaceae bacterium]
MRGPLARLDRSREELAKAWLVRLIERASLEEIRDLPTDRIARELPELISDLVGACAENNGLAFELTEEQLDRASSLAALRAGRESSAVAELTRDVAALQTVMLQALREELSDSDPARFADIAERLADATGAVQAAAVEELVRHRSRELESQANTDALTGLYNLRYFQRELAQLLDVQKRYEQPFGLLLLDIDGLKRINDAHGHQAGDRVLMQVAMSLRRSVRTVDTAARLGGDEFAVIAPLQDTKGAAILAERLAAAARDEVVPPDEPPVTVSIGVASSPEHGEEPEGLIEIADKAMYRAKAAGEAVAVGEPNGSNVAEEGASR